jgi:hypothetical protein
LYSSQVLIPTNASGKRFALMGPLTVFEILKDTRTIFPVCYDFKPLFNKMETPRLGTDNVNELVAPKDVETPVAPPKDPFILDYVKRNFKPFRSCPTADVAYQNWFTKVEVKKSHQWEELGI